MRGTTSCHFASVVALSKKLRHSSSLPLRTHHLKNGYELAISQAPGKRGRLILMMSDSEDNSRKSVEEPAKRFFDLPDLPVRSAFGAWCKKEDEKLRAARLDELEKKKEVVKAVLQLKDEESRRAHEEAKYKEDKKLEVRKFCDVREFVLRKWQDDLVLRKQQDDLEYKKHQEQMMLRKQQDDLEYKKHQEQKKKGNSTRAAAMSSVSTDSVVDDVSPSVARSMRTAVAGDIELLSSTSSTDGLVLFGGTADFGDTTASINITSGNTAASGDAATSGDPTTIGGTTVTEEMTTSVGMTAKDAFKTIPAKEKNSLETAMCSRTDVQKSISVMRTLAAIELAKLQKEFGKFSYYYWRKKLIVHLEDDKARHNHASISLAVNGIAQKYLQDQHSVSVEVSVLSLKARLCSPRIGSKLTVNHTFQTAGMYVLYRGIPHWVSVAHNYVLPPCIALTQAAFNECPVIAAIKELAHRNSNLAFEDESLLSAMPYACLMHEPQDRMGRHLLHSVDIMIGRVPQLITNNEVQEPGNLDALCEVRGQAGLIYEIRNVWRPTPSVGNEHENYARYDIAVEENYIRYRNVVAILPGNNIAEGTIESSLATIYLDGEEYQGAILIASSNGVSPRFGDSGSVWVARDTSEAVAITVGKMNAPDAPSEEVWVALLLFPCLEVLCLEYKDTLPDVSQLTLVRGEPVAEF